MAEEVKEKKVETESTVKTPDAEVKKEVKAEAAPVKEKPVETKAPDTSDAPDEGDISNVISLLNEIQAITGGKGDITDIPENLRGVIKYVMEKMVALRDAFQDPLFKAVLDDMVDQQEDGKTPSLLVAVARNAPMEELQDLAENENYADVQGAVDERLAKDKSDAEAEETLAANFDESQAAGEEYAKEMGYDDAEKQDLFSMAMDWFSMLGDGKLTKDEWAKVDKMRNYDKDTEELRGQIPPEPVKEVVPDQATMEAAVREAPAPTKTPAPRNTLETLGAAKEAVSGFDNVGKRRFMKGRT
jgi:hypothetical protein